MTLFRCVCSLLTGYSLASPYSACLLELAFWLNCLILFVSNISTWYLLECLVYSGKERQRGRGLCFQGLVKAWVVLYSSNPILDAEAGGTGIQDQPKLCRSKQGAPQRDWSKAVFIMSDTVLMIAFVFCDILALHSYINIQWTATIFFI